MQTVDASPGWRCGAARAWSLPLLLSTLGAVAGCGEPPKAQPQPADDFAVSLDTGTDATLPTDASMPDLAAMVDAASIADLVAPPDLLGLSACPFDGGAEWKYLQVDVLNCGQCGVRCCFANFCHLGECVGDCPVGSTMCRDQDVGCSHAYHCSFLMTSVVDCGRCASPCKRGQQCVNGACV